MSKAREILDKISEVEGSDVKIAKGFPKQMDKGLVPEEGKTVKIPIAKIDNVTGSKFKGRTIELSMEGTKSGGVKFWPLVDGKIPEGINEKMWPTIKKLIPKFTPRFPGNWPLGIMQNFDDSGTAAHNLNMFGIAMVKSAMAFIRTEEKKSKKDEK